MLPFQTRRSSIILLSILPLVSSCKPHSFVEDGAARKVLVIPAFERPSVINPFLTKSTISAAIVDILFDGLIKSDERFVPRPHLAESWNRSADGRTWTIRLRHGVAFHDGSELTAEDVAFTFERLGVTQKGGRFGFVMNEVDRITVKDRYTLEIVLKNPLGHFVETLTMGIAPKHLWKDWDPASPVSGPPPVGSGPYKLTVFSDDEIVLDANTDYFLGKPEVSRIRVVVYPSQKAAWAKLLAGEVDFVHYLRPDDYELLKQIPTLDIYSAPMPYYYILALNLERSRFQDRRVRQALNYAVDKEAIIKMVLKGQGQPAGGTIFPGSWAYNPSVKPYPYDPRKALELLKQAGWADHDGDHWLDRNGEVFEIIVHVNSGDNLKERTLLLVQQQLVDLGIRLEIKFFGAADLDFLFDKTFDAILPEIHGRPDTDSSYEFWHSSQIADGFNLFSYRNSEVDRWLDQERMAFDPEERKAVYFSYQEEMSKDPPGIFLFWTNYLVGVHKRFKGVKISPLGPFANIGEWYVSEDEP